MVAEIEVVAAVASKDALAMDAAAAVVDVAAAACAAVELAAELLADTVVVALGALIAAKG